MPGDGYVRPELDEVVRVNPDPDVRRRPLVEHLRVEAGPLGTIGA